MELNKFEEGQKVKLPRFIRTTEAVGTVISANIVFILLDIEVPYSLVEFTTGIGRRNQATQQLMFKNSDLDRVRLHSTCSSCTCEIKPLAYKEEEKHNEEIEDDDPDDEMLQ